ncbi:MULTISPECIES: DUF427 domain-containing protein [unclassified Cupriavidus]|uniref:DUF427 domain-containing protein n=1 Tax=unclassified Cupriavidus TaxID=2640874 RepID=UPI0028B9F2A1|nr:DUF427 domain-containing protein [Cupriavidus sp. SZY C1]MDT6961947.1 DUF427 domain-containing protein [Cupriavidus sp. SZY C1]
MTGPSVKIPGPDHPITITPQRQRVVVKAGGHVVADSRRALNLQEASYPAVQYIPREDVDMAQLSPTSHTSHCPYKGDASYFSIASAGARGDNAVWSYEQPHAAVAQIAGHVAFYPNRVDSIELLD